MNDSKWYTEAVEFIKEGSYTKALERINLAIDNEPNRADYIAERGVIFFHLQENTKALEEMDKAVELDPNYAYRYSSRAYIKSSMNDLDGAIEDYKKAIEFMSK